MFGQSKTLPIILLVAANLVPLIGLFAFGWTVNSILVVYWVESVIIGILNIPRILAAGSGPKINGVPSQHGKSLGGKIFLSLFFTVHFGGFCAAHAAFLGSLFEAGPEFAQLLSGGPLLWTAAVFLFSHSVSFVMRLSRGEFVSKNPQAQLFAPYGRVMIMHMTVLFGGFAMQSFGAPIAALILLIALKTIVDLGAHLRETRKAEETATPPIVLPASSAP
ncbi:DUF6498-containing protein [Fretibacter rubidus]|uniref:DUF6498-containing protein n=1 Tax=Fretibacter rubidus TaxID=570162 RepID=UPI00352ABCB6